MRIMDCVLILFRRNMSFVMQPDLERPCPRPSWSESLKVTNEVLHLSLAKKLRVAPAYKSHPKDGLTSKSGWVGEKYG